MICIKTHDFYYDLPQELIAQTPLQKRDTSRLLTLNKVTGETGHYHFYDLPKFLKPGDCLVLNDSRVLPARLIGHRVPTGGVCEVVLLIDRGENTWECLVRPGKKLREGAKLSFGEGELTAEVTKVLEGGNRLIQFHYEGIFLEILEHLGKMPLPPYIKEELQDAERYQTVYSKEIGSAAAPTAGLHFTKELLEEIQAMGVQICYQPDQSQGRQGHLRWNNLLPYNRKLGRGGRHVERVCRLDQHLHLPWLSLQGIRWSCYKLPPSRVYAHYARLCTGRAKACAGGL